MKNLKKLNLNVIRLDGGTQPRFQLNQDSVKEFAEKMKDGEIFPPLTVFHDGSEYWLAGGFTRYHAIKSNGFTSAECEVINGTLREASLYAKGDNGKHGKPLTAEEIRANIRSTIEDEEYGKWSNNKIAKALNTSTMTVARVRIAMQDEAKSKGEQPKDRKYIDRHGNEVTMNTENIGKKDAPRKTTKPDMTSKLVSEEIVEQKDQEIKELVNTINEMAEENTLLRDKIAIGQWDATEIEKIDAQETIENLREQIRILEIDNKTLRESRDLYQAQNADLIKTVKGLTAKLKKLETA